MKLLNYNEFQNTLDSEFPHKDWSEALKSLWHEAKGDWEASHSIAQDIPSEVGNWIHAYLHRKEGDEWNAGYWYRQAKRPFPTLTLEEEFKEILEYVLD